MFVCTSRRRRQPLKRRSLLYYAGNRWVNNDARSVGGEGEGKENETCIMTRFIPSLGLSSTLFATEASRDANLAV